MRSAIRSSSGAVVTAFLLFVSAGAALAAPAASGAPVAPAKAAEAAPKNDDCLACHADKDLRRSKAAPRRSASVTVDAAVLGGSVHGGLDCVACHTTATAPHDEKLSPVRCAACHDDESAALAQGAHGAAKARARATCQACHGTHGIQRAASLGVATCATCHGAQAAAYRGSIHGQSRAHGGSEAATCRSCHGPAHTLLTRTDPRAPTYHLNLPRTCAQCHADPALAARYRIPIANVYQMYMDSIHGRAVSRSGLLVAANCSDCHGAHEIKPHTDPTARIFRANVPATCGGCHAGVQKQYAESVHGRAVAQGNPVAPVCTDCHTAHQIRRVDAAPWQLDVIRECGTCHEESLKTYRDTFHGKVTALGATRVAKCADCHGSHGILPTHDPASRVSATNIVATCRQCHADATWKFAEFHPHADPTNRARFPSLYYPYILMTALLFGTFGFFGLHTVLWLPRSLVERLRNHRRRGEEP